MTLQKSPTTFARHIWSNRFVWSDLDISHASVHPALKSVVVTINFHPEDPDAPPFVDTRYGLSSSLAFKRWTSRERLNLFFEKTFKRKSRSPWAFRWGIYFSGLLSLGNHPPPHGRLPTDGIVLCLNDTYFSSAAHLKDNVAGTFKPRYLHIGKAEECQAVGSYDTHLLSRLQYVQRVLKKQEEVNLHHKNHLMSRGVVDVGEAKSLLPAKKEVRTKYATMFSMQVCKIEFNSARFVAYLIFLLNFLVQISSHPSSRIWASSPNRTSSCTCWASSVRKSTPPARDRRD
jgi:hypothetical protein